MKIRSEFRWLTFIVALLALTTLVMLISCMQQQDPYVLGTGGQPGSNGHGLATLNRLATTSECQYGGSAVDIYQDLDDSGTVTEGDKLSSTLFACNPPPNVTATPDVHILPYPSVTPSPTNLPSPYPTVSPTSAPTPTTTPTPTAVPVSGTITYYDFRNKDECQVIIPGFLYANKRSAKTSSIRLYANYAYCITNSGHNSGVGVIATLSSHSFAIYIFDAHTKISVQGLNGPANNPLVLKKTAL